MQKWNISMYRTQKADEKSDIICLVMFTPKVMVIRMSKMAHFMHCLLHTEEKRPSLGKIFTCTLKVLFGHFTKYYGLCSSDLIFANCQHLKIQNFTSTLLTQHFFFLYFYPQYLTNSCVQSLLNIPFSARTWWDLLHVLNDFAKLANFSAHHVCQLYRILKGNTWSRSMITLMFNPKLNSFGYILQKDFWNSLPLFAGQRSSMKPWV